MNNAFFESITNPVEAVKVLGPAIAKSQMFSCQNEEQGMVIALTCLIEGRSPMQLSQRYDLMFGKMRLKSSAALADFKKLGGSVTWHSDPHNGTEAAATFERDGQKLRYAYTLTQAEAQGLTKRSENWKVRPANMLRARVISGALGMIAPEVFAGEDDEPMVAASEAPALTLERENEATPGDRAPSAPTAASPAPSPEPEPEPDDEKELAEQGLAPEQPQEEKPAEVSGPIPDMLARIQQAGIADEAYNWMLAKGWLKEGQTFDAVSEANAAKVCNKFDRFEKAVKEAAA